MKQTNPSNVSHGRDAEWGGAANEPVGDEGRELAAAEQDREVLARAEPLEEVETDLDEVAAGCRGGHRVGQHLLHRRRHQRHAQERHLQLRALLLLPLGWPPGAVCVDANAGNRPSVGVGGLLAGVVVVWEGVSFGLGWWRAQVGTGRVGRGIWWKVKFCL